MSTEKSNDIKESKGSDLLSLTTVIMFFNAGFFLFYSLIYILKYNDTEKWFSRLSLSIICLGLGVIIYGINEIIKNGKSKE